jgi:hypothetical protein
MLCVLPALACAAGPSAFWRGVWVVDRDAGAAAVSALDATQAHSLLGKAAALAPGGGSFAGRACPAADYQETRQDAAAFQSAFRVRPAALGIAGNVIDSVHFDCGDDAYDLIAIGPEQAILIYQGHVFHATKRTGG